MQLQNEPMTTWLAAKCASHLCYHDTLTAEANDSEACKPLILLWHTDTETNGLFSKNCQSFPVGGRDFWASAFRGGVDQRLGCLPLAQVDLLHLVALTVWILTNWEKEWYILPQSWWWWIGIVALYKGKKTEDLYAHWTCEISPAVGNKKEQAE